MTKHPIITPGSSYQFEITDKHKGNRLDLFLAEQFPDYSRSFLKKMIEEQLITINTKIVDKAGAKLKTGDLLSITVPEAAVKQALEAAATAALGVKIVFQNKDFAIINKPAGLIVHSDRAANTAPTLVTWLEHTFAGIEQVGYNDRPGIVHRLDKETSGLMVIPLTNQAFALFSALFKKRTIKKTYLAVVKGTPEKEGVFTGSIARHQTVRNKMTIHTEGKEARTDFTTLEYFDGSAFVEARPQTGRTHQIRIHFSSAGHGLLGDVTYGSRSPLINRHALHAAKLVFSYNDKPYEFTAPLPEDFEELLKALRRDK